MKSDQENSIITLRRDIKDKLRGEVNTEESPVGEHQSSGDVERAARTVTGQFRTLRDQIEHKIGTHLEANSPTLQWLIVAAASLITR